MTEKLPCDRCRRPATLQALFARDRAGVALLIGKLGPECFYIVARQVTASGYQAEREDASKVNLRGGA